MIPITTITTALHHLLTYAGLKRELSIIIFVSVGMVLLRRLGLLYLRISLRGQPVNWGVTGIAAVIATMVIQVIHDLGHHEWFNLSLDLGTFTFIAVSFIYLYRYVRHRMVTVQRPVAPTPVVQGALHAAATRARRQVIQAAANPRRWYAPWTRRH